MIRWFAALILVVFPCAMMAQTALVRTGEHANFTRVVVTIPPGTDWRLGRDEDGYVLRVPVISDFDLRSFFDLIPRTRIEDVSPGQDTGDLRLQVRCRCFAQAFVDRPDILVIDIRDGVAPQTALFEGSLDDKPFFYAVTAPVKVVAPPYNVLDNQLLPLVFPPRRTVALDMGVPDQTTQKSLVVEANPNADFAESGLVAPPTENPDLAALEQSITESLSRGLSQGLLDPDLGQSGPINAFDALQDLLPPGLEARTSVDLAAVPPNPRINITQEGRVCLPDAFFDIGSWGDSRSFSQQMSDARANLTGEFDRVDENAALVQARLFVYFGFGREAIQTLQLDGASSQERQYLIAAARIIDGDPVDSDLFKQQVSCTSSVALWAMLSAGDDGLDGKVDPPSVLRAFKALPPSLQAHLGPPLSQRFLAIDDNATAYQALAAARSAPELTADAELAETALLLGLGEADIALEGLTKIARTDIRASPEAMIAFLQTATDEDAEVSDADFILADAIRFENARQPVANDLGVAQARAYLHQGRFDAARALMDEISGTIDPGRQIAVKNELAAAATAQMDDAAFLAFAFDQTARPSSDSIENVMARRLLDLGFPEQASLFTAPAALPETEAERVYLRAKGALFVGDAEAALAHLDGVQTERGVALRQAARDMRLGIGPVSGSTIDPPNAKDLWRRGDWLALSTSDDPLLRDASAAILEQTATGLEPTAPLASGRTLLEQSERSRAVVEGLLNRFAAPADF